MAVKKHGANGYKLGCRCFVCRRDHAAKMAAYRANRDGKANVPPAGEEAGRVELTVLAQIKDLNVTGAEADMVIALAHTNARFIDTISKEGRLHLMSGAQRNLLDAMDRLATLANPKKRVGAEDDDDDFLGSLGTPQS